MESGSKQELNMIASGEFDLLRSKQSPKSSLECIYNESSLSISSNGQHSYNIIVKKVIDLTEDDEGDEDGDGYYSDDARSVLSVQSKLGGKKDEEWTFVLGPHLNFKKTWSNSGQVVFVWNNSLGDERDERVQFVISNDVSNGDVDQFLEILYRCYYMVVNKKPISSATEIDIKDIELLFNTILPEDRIETSPDLSHKLNDLSTVSGDDASSGDEGDTSEIYQDASDTILKKNNSVLSVSSVEGEELCSFNAKFYLFDPIQEDFILQDDSMQVSLLETGKFKYWFSVVGQETKIGKEVSQDLNPTFDDKREMFVFNYSIGQITLSFMLRFATIEEYKAFKLQWSSCMWMTVNKVPWEKITDKEKQYVINPTKALVKDLDTILGFDEDEVDNSRDEKEYSEDESDDEDEGTSSSVMISSEQFEQSSSDRSSNSRSTGNKSLTVSFKNNRSYVVRGDKIGVFKTGDASVEGDDEDGLEYVSVIKGVKGKDGRSFEPENPMMYMEDRSLILGDKQNLNKLYRMDIETGKVVEEWGTGDKNVVQYGPTKKYDQLTAESTIVGVSNNTIFKMDPRIPNENKIVQDESKQYVTKYNFSSIGTTENGYIAVGSEKGDIKLYDRLGIRAKTAIPSLGEPIRYITTSADGKWLLATCDTSLLLMDLTIKTGNNKGNIGFMKSFPAAENVKTYILRMSPENASYMVTYTKKPIKFSRAYFNAGVGKKEQKIITSTGPFAITWSLNKIIQNGNGNDAYTVNRYDNDIVEDNFKFGTHNRVIVALKDDISLSKVKSFKQPSKDVLMPKNNIRDFYD